MNIRQYRAKRLNKYNKAINLVLWLALGFVVISIVGIGMMRITLDYFETRGNAISTNMTGVVSETARDYVEQELGDLPEDVIESQIQRITEDLTPSIEKNYNESIDEGQAFLEEKQKEHPILKLQILNFLFALLLVLFFVNNDLVLTIDYLSKKLLTLVPILFIIPYFLFKSDFLLGVMAKVDFVKYLNFPIDIDPKAILLKSIELMSDELAMFYLQFMPYALVAIFVGLILWFGNRFFLLPFFAQKHGYINEEAEAIKKKIKEEKKEKKKEAVIEEETLEETEKKK
ncbi:MAG: hypothetical protein ABIB43_04660 [archaeon]